MWRAPVLAVLLGSVHSAAAIWPFNRKKQIKMVTEEIVVEVETLYAKVQKLTLAPVIAAYDDCVTKYSALPVAEYLSLPQLVLAVVCTLLVLWLAAKLFDGEPYLYNDGALGPLEKQSVFINPETGKFKPPTKAPLAPGKAVKPKPAAAHQPASPTKPDMKH